MLQDIWSREWLQERAPVFGSFNSRAGLYWPVFLLLMISNLIFSFHVRSPSASLSSFRFPLFFLKPFTLVVNAIPMFIIRLKVYFVSRNMEMLQVREILRTRMIRNVTQICQIGHNISYQANIYFNFLHQSLLFLLRHSWMGINQNFTLLFFSFRGEGGGYVLVLVAFISHPLPPPSILLRRVCKWCKTLPSIIQVLKRKPPDRVWEQGWKR